MDVTMDVTMCIKIVQPNKIMFHIKRIQELEEDYKEFLLLQSQQDDSYNSNYPLLPF